MHGQLHARYMQNLPPIFGNHGYGDLAIFVEKNMGKLVTAVQSPDSDHPELKLPDNLLPSSLRASNTSLVKWEHIIPLDMPKNLTDVLKLFVEGTLKMPFKYADETFADWYSEAVKSITTDLDKSLWHLGRCCHLAQDVCVPMHVAASSGLTDIYDILLGREPNHDRYEKFCDAMFAWDFGKTLTFVPVVSDTIRSAAEASSSNMKYCDGISMPVSWSRFMPAFLFRFLQKMINDDYLSASKYTNFKAQSLTASVVFQYYAELTKAN